MDIDSSISSLLASSNCITIWDKNSLEALKSKQYAQYNQLSALIDKLGAASAKAQLLNQAVTTTSKIICSDCAAYLYCEDNKAIALLKVGRKNLFYRNEHGVFKEIKPLCVLDFYVYESMQRNGVGLKIFNYFLQRENIYPSKLAYDRPSPKLLSFLKKHFSLCDYIPQGNNFVIFKKYFMTNGDNQSITC